jgi:hypothetical protein
MKNKLPDDQQDIIHRAITTLKDIAGGRPCICLIGFDAPGGVAVVSASNLDEQQQLEMLSVMVEGYQPVPHGTPKH